VVPPLRTLLAALALAAPLQAAAQARVRVVVMDLEPATPELKSAAGALTGVVLDELGRQPQIAALGSSEIAAMIGLERQRALLGCEGGTDCLAEMGNALGAKYVLRGTVGALGKSLRVDLTLLDTARAGAAAREGGTASREEDLESEARSAVRRLAAAVQRPAPTSTAAPGASTVRLSTTSHWSASYRPRARSTSALPMSLTCVPATGTSTSTRRQTRVATRACS